MKDTVFPQKSIIPNSGSYGDNIWICQNCETKNTGERCMVCQRQRPDAPPRKYRWYWIFAAVCALAVIFWISGIHAHKWEDATCESPRSCSICGKTEGSALGHSWLSATCTEAKYCTRCGVNSGKPLGHDWMEATRENPATCRRCGATEGEPAPGLELNPNLEYTGSIVRTVTTSSILDGDIKTHEPSNLIDNNLETNWAEGAKGYGIGESIAFQFNGTYALNAITIYNGNQSTEELFKKNGRIKRMTISFPNGQEMTCELPDLTDPCIIPLDPMLITGSLVFTIDSVYEGNTYEDTVVSEIGFMGYEVIG